MTARPVVCKSLTTKLGPAEYWIQLRISLRQSFSVEWSERELSLMPQRMSTSWNSNFLASQKARKWGYSSFSTMSRSNLVSEQTKVSQVHQSLISFQKLWRILVESWTNSWVSRQVLAKKSWKISKVLQENSRILFLFRFGERWWHG